MLLVRIDENHAICSHCWKKRGRPGWRGIPPTKAEINASVSKMEQPKGGIAPL